MMVTTPEAIEPPPPAGAEGILREAIGGDRRAAVRRLVLYAILGVALAFAPLPAAVVGVIAVILLAATDRLA